jgi:hypothetical protein
MKIFPLYYFPPVSWFAAASHAGEIVLEQHEFYKKQHYFNRTNILTPNGPLKLSLPIHKAEEHTPLRLRTISEEGNWQKVHWKSLESAYRSSPFFEFYEDRFTPFFEGGTRSLQERNLAALDALIDALHLDIRWSLSSSYQDSSHYEADFRDDFEARRRTSPPWFHPAPYQQVFGAEFVPDLGILDLLFNCGPDSVRILRESYRPL